MQWLPRFFFVGPVFPLLMLLLAAGSLFGIAGAEEGTGPDGAEAVGCFWHITDIHLDPNYTVSGKNRQKSTFYKGKDFDYNTCWKEGGGKYGDYNCDSSQELVQSLVDFVKNKSSGMACDPFIIWTGDDVSHAGNEYFTDEVIMERIEILSLQLGQTSLKIYPILGNHDVHPSGQFSGETSNQHLSEVANRWKDLLPAEATSSFRKGGYYSISRNDSNLPFRLVGLNTNVYFFADNLTKGMTDPLEQFDWLESELGKSVEEHGPALVFGHIAPGVFERYYRKNDEGTHGHRWISTDYNERLLKVINGAKNSSIVAQLYGHGHMDSLKIFDSGSFALLAPAVTPWRSNLVEETGSNNPGVRLFYFDKNTGEISNYVQYYVDLYKANEEGGGDIWQPLYNFSSYYGKGKPSYAAIKALAEEGKTDWSTFKKYYRANTVAYEDATKENCNSTCRIYHYCATVNQGYPDFDDCVVAESARPAPNNSTTTPPTTTTKAENSAESVVGGCCGWQSLLTLSLSFIQLAIQ